MAKRLQVTLEDSEYLEIQRLAGARGVSIREWIHQALEQARMREATQTIERKLQAIRAAAGAEYPSVDIDQMLAEIECGHRTDP